MHPHNRIPSSGQSTPSPPPSPLRSPCIRRSKQGRFPSGQQPFRTFAQRLAWLILSVLLRRQGIFLFAPLIYISGMMLYMGTVSLDVGPDVKQRSPPGSVYRSPQVYAKLRPEMDSDNSTSDTITVIDPLDTEALKAALDKNTNAAYLIIRGMKTLHLRVHQQNSTASRMAYILEAHPKGHFVTLKFDSSTLIFLVSVDKQPAVVLLMSPN